jgi:hypothetical protein
MAPEIISHNFQFLTAYDRQFVRLATLAERYFRSDPNTSLIKCKRRSKHPSLQLPVDPVAP